MTTAASHRALSVGVADHHDPFAHAGKSFTFTVTEQVATWVDGIIGVEFQIRCSLNVKIKVKAVGFALVQISQ